MNNEINHGNGEECSTGLDLKPNTISENLAQKTYRDANGKRRRVVQPVKVVGWYMMVGTRRKVHTREKRIGLQERWGRYAMMFREDMRGLGIGIPPRNSRN